MAVVQCAEGALARERLAAAVEERLDTAMGLVNTATAELVATIGEALRTEAWQGGGILSPEHWVSWRCGVSAAHARRLVAMARKLPELPGAAAAFAEGVLSEDQTSVICRHVDAAHDAEVMEFARYCTVNQLRRVLPSVAAPEPEEADTGEPGGDEEGTLPDHGDVAGRREVSFGYGDDGRWWLRGLLPPEEGAVVEKALEQARAALFRGQESPADQPQDESRVGWADALVHLAEVGLTNLEGSGRPPADRYQVIVHLDAERARAARLHLGPALPASLGRYLSCDATIRAVLERAGTPIHVFERQRTVDDRLRALIEHRDGGCRVPGCAQRRWLHIHHLVHHEDGGRTVPENLCALCPAHHRMHHAGRLGIRGDPSAPDGLEFTDAAGRPLRGPRPRPPGAPPAQATRAMGLPEPRWAAPLGERLQSECIIWS